MWQPGLLILNKPVGVRSTYCVERVRKLLPRNIKVGHGGTLDSSASGVLILLVAGATRLSGIVMQMPKRYRATVKLGSETTTCDYTGETTRSAAWDHVAEADIDRALFSFFGWRMQVPPKVSAVHVDGQRAYDVYRNTGDVKISPRPVYIERIDRVTPLSQTGTFDLSIYCGKGTYIRSIARDLGRALQCGAHVAGLVREASGPFSAADALSVDAGFEIAAVDIANAVRPIESLGSFLPFYTIAPDEAAKLSNGLPVPFHLAARKTFGLRQPGNVLLIGSKHLATVAHLEQNDRTAQIVPDANIAIPDNTPEKTGERPA